MRLYVLTINPDTRNLTPLISISLFTAEYLL